MFISCLGELTKFGKIWIVEKVDGKTLGCHLPGWFSAEILRVRKKKKKRLAQKQKCRSSDQSKAWKPLIFSQQKITGISGCSPCHRPVPLSPKKVGFPPGFPRPLVLVDALDLDVNQGVLGLFQVSK